MTGFANKPIKFSDDFVLIGYGNEFPSKFLMVAASSTLDIYDMTTMQKSTSLPASFDEYIQLHINWNNNQTSAFIIDHKTNQAYIIKQVELNKCN